MVNLLIGVVALVLGVLFAIFGDGFWLVVGIVGILLGLVLLFLGYRTRSGAA